MKAQKTLLIVLSALLLTTSSCSWFKPKPVPVPVYIESSIPIQEHPKPLSLIAPKLYVVSAKNLDEFLASNEKRNGSIVFIAMDVKDYEISAYNYAAIDRYTKQLLDILNYYETRIKEREKLDDIPSSE